MDVLCVGEALWDLVAPQGRTFADAPSLELRAGGGAVNTALALAARGRAVGLAAQVGDDALGDALVTRLAKLGVDVSCVTRSKERTGLLLAAGGRFVSYRAAEETTARLPRGVAPHAIVFSGLLPSQAQADAFAKIARSARRRGALVVVDMNARPRMWCSPEKEPPGRQDAKKSIALASWRLGGSSSVRVAVHAWLTLADLVKVSADDLTTIRTSEEELRAITGARPVIVVTAGGAAASASGAFGRVEAKPRALDGKSATMGAGDAFVAGVVDALIDVPGRVRSAEPGSRWLSLLRRGHSAARRVLDGRN